MSRFIGLVLICTLLTTVSHAEVLRLDFGAAESPVRPGDVAVTDVTMFRTGARAGWLDRTGLTAIDRPIPRKPHPPIIYTSDWRQDAVQGRGVATLRVALPPGRYRAWIMSGPGGGVRAQVWDITVSSGAANTSATFYSGNSCRAMTMPLTVNADGVADLTIRTRSRWTLNAIMIASDDAWPATRDGLVAAMEREAFMLPDSTLR